MSDNGEAKKEEVIKTAEQIKAEAEEAKKPKLVMQVFMNPDGSFEMKSSLIPAMMLWVMEQIKFNLLQQNNEQQNKIIAPAKHGILDFAKRRFK